MQDPDLQNKLEHIVKLSLSYVKPTGGTVTSFTRDFMFLIFKDDLEINGESVPAQEYNYMIGAFDRYRFYSPDEILSTGSGSDRYSPVLVTNFEPGITIAPEFIKRWERANRFLTFPTDIMFPSTYQNWWES